MGLMLFLGSAFTSPVNSWPHIMLAVIVAHLDQSGSSCGHSLRIRNKARFMTGLRLGRIIFPCRIGAEERFAALRHEIAQIFEADAAVHGRW